jgi:UDP-N-acetylmuramoylalanine--D-glutamate ligase
MRDEKVLAPTLAALSDLEIRYVLGRHEMADFEGADLVIKNPAVKPDSPYLKASRAVETDISVFLRLTKAPILAVTGSKGKSTASTALHHCLVSAGRKALLGGNITVSPLSFFEETGPDTPVVLELSSWQLADLKGLGVLKPRVALLTSMMPDHMNRYSSMEEYMADKRLIYADQDASSWTVANADDEWNVSFAAETKARVGWYGDGAGAAYPQAWLEAGSKRGLFAQGPDARPEEILPAKLLVPGGHQRKNLLGAGLALRLFGLEAGAIARGMASFRGVEHRLEFFAEKDGTRWYNDSAATIPQAVAAALGSFEEPMVLITGGTDKNLDFGPVAASYGLARDIILLSGSGTDKLIPLLKAMGKAYQGPFADFSAALAAARDAAGPGDVVILSPGCTSFGMFLHEFDRGNKFKEGVRAMLGL